LLKNPTTVLFRELWYTPNPRERLVELGHKYSVTSGGDLHATVRNFLRLHWRKSPPAALPEIAHRLLDALKRIDTNADQLDNPGWVIERANLESWVYADESYWPLFRATVVLLAYDLEVWQLSEIIDELSPESAIGKENRDALGQLIWASNSDKIVVPTTVLQQTEIAVNQHWSNMERACLNLLWGLTLASEKSYRDAVDRLERALSTIHNPARRSQIADSYLRSAGILAYQHNEKSIGERALNWINKFSDMKVRDRHLYNIFLVALDRFDEAECGFLEIISEISEKGNDWHMLAHMYEEQGRNADARKAFAAAYDSEPDNPVYLSCWAKLCSRMGDANEAVRLYEQAGGLDELKTEHLGSYLASLNALGNQGKKAQRVAKKIAGLESGDVSETDANSIAWSLYERRLNCPLLNDLRAKLLLAALEI
jgi:tetratricopeptide (TPR) repeat protein